MSTEQVTKKGHPAKYSMEETSIYSFLHPSKRK